MARRLSAARLETSVDDVLQRLQEGKYEDAVRYLEAILADGRQELPEDHLVNRRALGLIGRTRTEQGEYERAYANLRQAIALEGRVVGVESPSFARIAVNLAAVLTRSGRAVDAEALLLKVLSSDRTALSPGEDTSKPAPRTLAPSGNAEADEHLQIFLALPAPPPLSEETRATARRLLAEAWITQGRYEEACESLESAVARADEMLPPDHPERWRTRATLGKVFAFQRRPEQAAASLRRAAALAQVHAGEHHPDAGRILAELARVEHRLGRPEAVPTA
jgi:tetratricopeptide (TPR) repeat protein